MAYTITSDTVGLAIGPMSETANDLQEALNKARQMCETMKKDDHRRPAGSLEFATINVE
jgi:predicted AlkP superfamily pyrophosphatase or phosphodiesterase